MFKNASLVVLGLAVAGLLGFGFARTEPVQVGSVVSNQQSTPFYFQAGFTGVVQRFVSTTTVACIIRNPSNIATTTFSSIAINVPVSTTTTTVLGIATSTYANRFATTTALLSTTIAANAKATATYIPTSNNNLLAPGEVIKVGYMVGTTLPTVAQQQSGTCSAVFNVLQ